MNSDVILVDKPAGMSSFGVVARVRRVLTERENARRLWGAERTGVPYQRIKRVKVGHTGTLDPFATGLLILLTGNATKRAGEFLKLDKEYIATLRLGEVSTTGDPEGEIRPYNGGGGDETEQASGEKVEQVGREIPNKMTVEKCVETWPVENWQKVPQFSAVKINGQRAYKLAREGKEVEMPVRKVAIYEMELLEYEWPMMKIRCKVSSGTYIRALAEEIGGKLGVGAYLTELRRTQVGEYNITQAKTLDTLLADAV